MINDSTGNLLRSDADALVNTVNCVGFMGKGIALQFKQAYPENFRAYQRACRAESVVPGKMFVFETGMMVNPKWIINFPTKRHWRGKSRVEDIKSGLAALTREVEERGIRSIAIPPLGCGNGGLKWSLVRPLIEAAFEHLPNVRVDLYAPRGAPDARQMPVRTSKPNMTPARALIVKLMEQYQQMAYRLTLLEVHKLMYFMQEAGEHLKLGFVKGPYGPYAERLRHVLSLIEGHFITGYGDAEDDPEKQIELNTQAWERAERYLRNHFETHARFDRVGDLIRGFETPYGMEVLATVHWVAKQEGASAEDDAVAGVYAWNDRKRMFQERHIRVAWEVLDEKGWLAQG